MNCEADSLNEMKDLEINTELYNDHDGEQFVKNSASIMDVEIEIEIDTCGDEKDIAFNSQSDVCGKSRKRSKRSHYYDTCTPPKQMARERKKKPKPLDNHDNLHSDSKMAERKKKRPSQCFPQAVFAWRYRHALKIPRHASHSAAMLPAMHTYYKAKYLFLIISHLNSDK